MNTTRSTPYSQLPTPRIVGLGIWLLGVLLIAQPGFAQAPHVISLSPAQPARWDVAAQITWFGNNKSDVVPDWNRWYSAGAGGMMVGRYWTPHLKTEVAATVSRTGRIYVTDPVVITGLFPTTFVTRERLFQATTVTAAVSYQFLENEWVHPFVGGGLEVARERQRVNELRQTIPVRDPASSPFIPGSPDAPEVTYTAQPFVNAGFKMFASERVFARTEVMTSINSRGVAHAAWSAGMGVEF
jgi:hypothetical protein